MLKILHIQLTGIILLLSAGFVTLSTPAVADDDPMQKSIQTFFNKRVEILSKAAEQCPTKTTFRKIMKPLAENLPDFREATLLSTNFVIQLTYYKRHRLAVGYDLKRVGSLKHFHKIMLNNPAPQISGPTKSKFMRPSVIVLRHPVMENNKLTAVISLMVSTDDFLDNVGLAKRTAYRIRCSDGIELSKGILSDNCKTINVKLPSAEWVVEYDK